MNKLQVQSLMNKEELEFLYDTVKKSKRGVVVELGSHLGGSTLMLAKGSLEGASSIIYSVDDFSCTHEKQKKGVQEEFLKNMILAGCSGAVFPINMDSLKAAKMFPIPINILIIDANHDYSAVKADWKAWFPKVAVDGVIMLHDSGEIKGWYGPRKLAEEMLKNKKVKYLGHKHSLGVFRKVSE